MPKSFSEDGASGAFNSSDPPKSGGTMPGWQMAAAAGVTPGAFRPQSQAVVQPSAPTSGWGYNPANLGIYRQLRGFEDGGEVGADAPGYNDPGLGGGDFTVRINQAIATVNNALSYGRKLNGLGDGGGGEYQVAGNIPAVPASQSESGVAPTRPFPRLDPLPTPFGKRTPGGQRTSDAGEQEQSGSGATASNQYGIPEDDEEAA